MWEKLAGWVYGIVVVLILGGSLLHLAPKGVHQKFLRFFFGLIVLWVVAEPLLESLGITSYAREEYEAMTTALGQTWKREEIDSWKETTVQRREESMKEPLEQLVLSYGYELIQADMTWDQTGSQVISLTLEIRKKESEEADTKGGTKEETEAEEKTTDIEKIRQISSVTIRQEESHSGEETDSNEQSGSQESESLLEQQNFRKLQQAIEEVFSLSDEDILWKLH